MTRNSLTIALHEYLTNVRRKEFIFITLGLPVMMLVFAGIGGLGATMASGAFERAAVQRVGIVDKSEALDLHAAMPRDVGVEIMPYSEESVGQNDVRQGRIMALAVVPRDYLDTGHVTIYRRGGSLLNQNDRIPIGSVLERMVLSGARVDSRVTDRAADPVGKGADVRVLEKGRFVPREMESQAARFLVPYLATILLTTAIFISANYLLRGIADEKENRVIEVIISAVTPAELLLGKLVGLACVGLTQVGVWVTMAAIPATVMFSRVVKLTPASLIEIVVFFALGFALYATLMAGLGALGTSYRESQQIAGVTSIGAFFPFMMMPVIIDMPNGPIARAFSYVPFTAPTAMILRTAAGDVPLWDILISAAIVAVTIWVLYRLSAKLFRFGLLIYGKRPGIGETLRWLRQA